MTRAPLILLACLLSPGLANGTACEDAGHAAEKAAGLPADLLVAIGRVESGRRGADGHFSPWPWSVNAAGEGYRLASAADAVALVKNLRAQGVQSIDVGCFQVNLSYHANAFASVEEAFDPTYNARAAAAFLQTLRNDAGLERAIGRYHSGDPARGVPYTLAVMAAWRGGATVVWPSVSQAAGLVRVFVPGEAMKPSSGGMQGRLPRVFVPTGSRL